MLIRRVLRCIPIALLACVALYASGAPVALRAARMLDVGRATIIANPVVIIEGDRIASVGGPIPEGARVLDLGDVTILPGLIDMHTHITVGRVQGAQPFDSEQIEPADIAFRAAENARATVMAGFTTIRECGASFFVDVALKRAVERGTVTGPRVVPSGYQISPTGGHGDNVGYAEGVYELTPKQGIADGPDQLLFAVRYQIKHGAEVIKVMASSGVLDFKKTATSREFSDEELRTVVEEARRQGVRVAAHAHGTEGILAAVRAGVDSIEHGSMLSDEAIRLMKEHGTFLVPTLYVTTPEAGLRARISEGSRAKGKAMAAAAYESFRKALNAGVRIAFGTDAGVYPHGHNARELAVMVSLGMKPADAIRSATLSAAELLGVDDRGEIAAGKLADIIAVPGNPLENVRALENVTFVMVGGAVVKR